MLNDAATCFSRLGTAGGADTEQLLQILLNKLIEVIKISLHNSSETEQQRILQCACDIALCADTLARLYASVNLRPMKFAKLFVKSATETIIKSAADT